MSVNTTTAISTDAQSAIDRLNTPSGAVSSNGLGTLTQADFLRLLTTQLTIQDPLEPVNNEEMLAQMAQFSSLAATTKSSSTLEDISTKLDSLIDAQNAAAQASRDAITAFAAGAAASPPDPAPLT